MLVWQFKASQFETTTNRGANPGVWGSYPQNLGWGLRGSWTCGEIILYRKYLEYRLYTYFLCFIKWHFWSQPLKKVVRNFSAKKRIIFEWKNLIFFTRFHDSPDLKTEWRRWPPWTNNTAHLVPLTRSRTVWRRRFGATVLAQPFWRRKVRRIAVSAQDVLAQP